MKSFTVKMTTGQASRIEKMADALRMEPGNLLKTLVLSDLDSWDCTETFLSLWPGTRGAYVTRPTRDAGGYRLEDDLADMFTEQRNGRRP